MGGGSCKPPPSFRIFFILCTVVITHFPVIKVPFSSEAHQCNQPFFCDAKHRLPTLLCSRYYIQRRYEVPLLQAPWCRKNRGM
ncbi:hypothetical protein LX32DRAFT_56815 [Colletotrichum zoysiae]|uniref:Uncharacterized protein n=1 Tax=Colletotrichum zoysiae TaxID=1216348 RepID=A0AAD9HTG0_9PEZI|nr:hypothetical protein LX32DRAFT_56815 [Colletotrichum zoysiae]